jgi:hypothetical protein
MKALFLTNEYPPTIYGGAGVHVDYLSRELAKIMDVEVRCFGDQKVDEPRSSMVLGVIIVFINYYRNFQASRLTIFCFCVIVFCECIKSF